MAMLPSVKTTWEGRAPARPPRSRGSATLPPLSPQLTFTVQPFSSRVEWKPTSSLSFAWRSTFTAPSSVAFFTPPMPFTGYQNCDTRRVSYGAIQE